MFDKYGKMEKACKSDLLHVLENVLDKNNYISPSSWTSMPSIFVIDFMATIRNMKIKEIKTFGSLFQNFISYITNICKNASRIDIIFDSYLSNSIKSNECNRRYMPLNPIELGCIRDETPIPTLLVFFKK